MSWTEAFPIMDQDMIDEFSEFATPEEKIQVREWYEVKETFNVQNKPHLVSFSLFWKPSEASKKVYPTPTREILLNADDLGLDLRFSPWPHYIQPVLDAMPKLLGKYGDVSVRVYLASDLDFLVPDFVEAGCEVCLMRHPSLAHSPGVAWRALAFSEKDRLVTLVDSDRMAEVEADIERTRAMAKAGLACWRVPIAVDLDRAGEVIYKSFIGCQMGAWGGWPMQELLQAYTWHSIRGTLSTSVDVPGCGTRRIKHGYWPNFGFEEWFLTTVMYPRMAAAGMITFVPAGARSNLLLLDIEYAAWANPSNELVLFPVAGCCAPPTSAAGNATDMESTAPDVASNGFSDGRILLPAVVQSD